MLTLDTKELPIPKLHKYLLGSIGPRPICFASTLSADGTKNIAPFSFFNVFSANPPIAIFSPARSGRTNTNKDTFHNIQETREVVINVVTYDIVQQMSLASSPYAPEVDEFVKAGLTPLASENVKPFRIKESPVQMECKVNDVVELGKEGGAGNLIICEILKIHIDEAVLDEHQMVDQEKIDLVARMGGNWYCRAHGESLFEIPKPITTCGIGIDQLPEAIKNSSMFTGNELAKLASVEQLPSNIDVRKLEDNHLLKLIRTLLNEDKIEEAWEQLV